MNKELALAVEFEKAPKELQELAKTTYGYNKSINKIKDEIKRLEAELSELENSFRRYDVELSKALKQWDVEALNDKAKAKA